MFLVELLVTVRPSVRVVHFVLLYYGLFLVFFVCGVVVLCWVGAGVVVLYSLVCVDMLNSLIDKFI